MNIGGKAASLTNMAKAGFQVPAWFVVSPKNFKTSKDLINKDLLKSINKSLNKLGSGLLAVRSSGIAEDGNESSFAGQFESYLNIKPKDVPKYIIKVWQSGFSDRIHEYYKQRNIDPVLSAPAVIIQKMINADCAGVAFSIDPVNPRSKNIIISAVRGLGDKLMSGEVDGDTYRLDRQGSLVSSAILKTPVLDARQCKQIAELAIKLEEHFKAPQDIEWAIEGNQVYLLQSRPITTVGLEGIDTIWDNSNIVESYPGIVSPLTFSFASNAYAAVYKKFSSFL